MTEFQCAAYLNCQGAYLLSNNEGMQAFAYFKSALQIMTNSSAIDEKPNHMVPQGDSPRLDSFVSIEASNSMSMDHSRGISSIVQQRSDKGQKFIFSRAFVFDSNVSTTLDHSFYCALLVFNMALSLHLAEKCMSSIEQKKVIHLYDLARSLLAGSSNASECLIISSAALNNTAQLYHEFSEFELCQQMMDGVVSMISSTACANTFEEQDIEDFLLNAMLLRGPTVARAA